MALKEILHDGFDEFLSELLAGYASENDSANHLGKYCQCNSSPFSLLNIRQCSDDIVDVNRNCLLHISEQFRRVVSCNIGGKGGDNAARPESITMSIRYVVADKPLERIVRMLFHLPEN